MSTKKELEDFSDEVATIVDDENLSANEKIDALRDLYDEEELEEEEDAG